MRLAFLPQAERDLEAIGDYIARDNPRRALSFLQELRAQCRKLLLAPQGYRLQATVRAWGGHPFLCARQLRDFLQRRRAGVAHHPCVARCHGH